MKYMLDTNICIYIIKKQPQNVLRKFESHSIGELCISSVTLSELVYGVEKSQHKQQNKQALQAFILPLEIMPYDEEAAYHYGHLRALLETKGTPIGSLDLLIAAHALSLKSTLVTNNKKEFTRVPHLKIEDWVH